MMIRLFPEHIQSFGLLNWGAVPPPRQQSSHACATGLPDQVLADLIQPGENAKS